MRRRTMASDPEQAKDPWRDSYEHFSQAMTHSLTASRLVTAGAVALGAAATAYLWDSGRREELVKSMRGLMPGWGGSPRSSGDEPSAKA